MYFNTLHLCSPFPQSFFWVFFSRLFLLIPLWCFASLFKTFLSSHLLPKHLKTYCIWFSASLYKNPFFRTWNLYLQVLEHLIHFSRKASATSFGTFRNSFLLCSPQRRIFFRPFRSIISLITLEYISHLSTSVEFRNRTCFYDSLAFPDVSTFPKHFLFTCTVYRCMLYYLSSSVQK